MLDRRDDVQLRLGLATDTATEERKKQLRDGHALFFVAHVLAQSEEYGYWLVYKKSFLKTQEGTGSMDIFN